VTKLIVCYLANGQRVSAVG